THMARTRKINAADMFDEIIIDLWGAGEYRLKEATRSTERAMEKLREEQETEDEVTDEQAFDHLASIIDVVLEPVEGQTRAKTVLKKLYKDDKIGSGHVMALVERVNEVRSERPT